jgi:LL-diaminopimelate aminotransferase
MGSDATFRGYGPDLGYDFLRAAIAEVDFKSRGADIGSDEIIVSDGSKCVVVSVIRPSLEAVLRPAVVPPACPRLSDPPISAGQSGYDGRVGLYAGFCSSTL